MRIDFHFNVEHRLQYACRVVRRARAADCRVLLYSRDADRLGRLDTALWTFSALDFVPHVEVDSPLAVRTPVLLASSLTGATPPCPVLVNRLARERFRLYREAGLQPQSHDRSAE